MNKTCNGHFFQYREKRYYRCFHDGRIIEWLIGVRGFEPKDHGVAQACCPSCSRPISDVGIRIRRSLNVTFRAVVQVRFPDWKTWEDFQEIGELK